jgi:hypothetical protein
VYQELENAGGVADTTPDLEACIIGPAYNVLTYVAGNTAALIKTAATSAASANGSIAIGSYTLTFDTIPPFVVGDKILIAGADVSGGALTATVTGALGSVLTLDTPAGITVTSSVVSKQGILTNPLVNNVYNLPGQVPGQVIDSSSIKVYANNAKVETVSAGFNGYVGSNALTYSAASGVCTTSVSSAVIINVTNANLYVQGDIVSITGAGVAAANLVARITNISGTTFTLDTAATIAIVGAVMSKISLNNVSSTTSTLLIEAGDQVCVNYTDTGAVAHSFNTTVIGINSATGNVTNITLADVLPVGVQVASTSTASITAGAVGFTFTSATGFATGDTILIKGAGVGGADHEAVIGTLTGAVVTGLSPATVTTVTGPVAIQKRATVAFKTRKLFNNQLIPVTKPISGGTNYVTTNTAIDGTITLNAGPEIIYGKLISGSIYIGYRALRTDLSGTVMAITDQADNLGTFGDVSEMNPLALGVEIALANTTTRVRAIAVSSNDDTGYFAALALAEGERLYALAPLTQSVSVAQAINIHVNGLSTPANASWRVGYVNTAIPSTVAIGSWNATLVNSNSGNNTIALNTGSYVLTSSNSTFISDGVVAGDTLVVTAGSGSPSPIGSMQILSIVSNQQIVVQALGVATGVNFYVSRTLSKTQKAAAVAATSNTLGSNRICHVQPDLVVVNIGGRNVVQPGYYLCAALAGLTAGFPAQQGFTNIGIAGISDLKDSNFYFTRAQLDTIAEAGTLLFVQETSGGIPYVRHELTTDMSVYEYRELQAVKNWDFLSYYFRDKLSPFIGKWNITPETLGVIHQTVDASALLLMSKKLPRIGAPLLGYTIDTLEQNPVNKDRVTLRIQTLQPKILNYLDVYLVI